jgi:putative membrane protein
MCTGSTIGRRATSGSAYQPTAIWCRGGHPTTPYSCDDHLMGYVIRLGISALALWISTLVLHGITLNTDSRLEMVGTLLLVAAIFGLVNAVLRPIIKTMGCGLYVLTLGLISLVVNGALFLLTSWIAGKLGLPFHIDTFWPTAVIGALIVGVVSWGLSLLVPDKED